MKNSERCEIDLGLRSFTNVERITREFKGSDI